MFPIFQSGHTTLYSYWQSLIIPVAPQPHRPSVPYTSLILVILPLNVSIKENIKDFVNDDIGKSVACPRPGPGLSVCSRSERGWPDIFLAELLRQQEKEKIM